MNIRRNIQFALKRRTYKGNKLSGNLPIRMRVSYNCQRIDCFNRPIKEEYRYGENNARESIYFYVDVGCPWKKTSSLQCEPSNG